MFPKTLVAFSAGASFSFLFVVSFVSSFSSFSRDDSITSSLDVISLASLEISSEDSGFTFFPSS
ncbi:hypothetical protein [Malacoplasma iowae]|uniref:hypothetical protein n=1 Tax=Malacoplasma iowae TaxID=2116 RepID=UPI0005677EC9|nr:hypothetical protein [Malacoplasma iowae]